MPGSEIRFPLSGSEERTSRELTNPGKPCISAICKALSCIFPLLLKQGYHVATNHLHHCQVKMPQTNAELDLLLRRQMPNERLDRIRDVFCFCALTGLAFTDVDHLRREHFTTDEEGQLWIHKPREKTSVMSRVPVLPQAAALLEKYRDDANCQARGKLLPVPSNTKMNACLTDFSCSYKRSKMFFELPMGFSDISENLAARLPLRSRTTSPDLQYSILFMPYRFITSDLIL